MHAALPYVLEALGQPLFDQRLRSQNQTVAFPFDFQVISRRQSQLIVNPLGDDYLPAHPDLDGGPETARLRLCFHIFVFYYSTSWCQGRGPPVQRFASVAAAFITLENCCQAEWAPCTCHHDLWRAFRVLMKRS
jgi:hypothetical protein